MISGLTMTLKPISMQKTSLRLFNLDKQQKQETSSSSSSSSNGGTYELLDASLTVRQNEEFVITCTVESSRPAADIRFVIIDPDDRGASNDNELLDGLQSLNSNTAQSYLTLSPSPSPVHSSTGTTLTNLFLPSSSSSSVIESSSSVVANADKTLKTVRTARLRVSRHDHNKMIACKAENGFSNQKWENKKMLNVLCKFPSFYYYN